MTNPERFEAFVREFQQMVFATAVRLLGNRTDAEDIAQSAFLRAFQHFDAIDGRPTAAGWLKTVTTNLCLNHLGRYRSRWRLFSEVADADSGGNPVVDSLVAPAEGADVSLDLRERQARLEGAVAALPDHQRVPLVLYHFEDRSYQEIADLLGVSLAKVKSDIHRARHALRQELTDCDE